MISCVTHFIKVSFTCSDSGKTSTRWIFTRMPTRHESNPYILIWVTVTAFEIWKAQWFLLPFVEAKLNNCCWPSLYGNTQPVCCGRTLGTHHPDWPPQRESARNPCNPTTHTHTHTPHLHFTCKQMCINYHCSIKLFHFSVLPFKHIRVTQDVMKSDYRSTKKTLQCISV